MSGAAQSSLAHWFAERNTVYTAEMAGRHNHRDDDDESVAVDDDEDDDEDDVNTPGALPDIEILKEQLGEPIQRTNCFGCRFVGESDAPIPNVYVQDILKIIADGIGKTDPAALAEEVAAKYEEMRRTIDTELPDWSAASILEHFYHHNTDPEMQQWLQLDLIQKVIRYITENSLLSGPKRRKIIDVRQANIVRDMAKLWWAISGKDASKHAFYGEGAHLASKDGSVSGILETHGKRIEDYFAPVNREPGQSRSRKRRRAP